MPIKRKPFFLTLGFLLVVLVLTIVITDYPLSFSSLAPKNISAIVLRDNVSPLEKRGTAWLTTSYLKKYYSQYDYIELCSRPYYSNANSANFKESLNNLLKKSDSVDVFFLAHGNAFYMLLGSIDSSQRKKIRMVYNSGCSDNCEWGAFKEKNVNYYVAHSGDNSISPIFYIFFLRRMFSEKSLADAVAKSNEPTAKTLGVFINEAWVKGSLGNFHDLKKEKYTLPIETTSTQRIWSYTGRKKDDDI